jgi:hypothetical protein
VNVTDIAGSTAPNCSANVPLPLAPSSPVM